MTVLRTSWSLLMAGGLLTMAAASAASLTWVGIIVALAFGALGLRAAVARVTINGEGLVIRTVLGTRVLTRSEVEAVRAEVIDEKVLTVWAPVVQSNGKPIVLRQLAGYSTDPSTPNRRVAKMAMTLDWWRSDSPPREGT